MKSTAFIGRPYLRLLFPFLIGILIAKYFSVPLFLDYLQIPFLVLLIYSGMPKNKPKFILSFGILFQISLIALGASCFPSSKGQEIKAESQFFKGIISSEAKTSQWTRFELELLQIDTIQTQKQQVLCYVEGEVSFQIGDTITAKGQILPIKRTSNPHSFDFGGHLIQKGIHYQVFLKDGQYLIMPYSHFSIYRQSQQIRQYYLNSMKVTLNNEEAYTILSALLFGYKNDLTADTKALYADTGAMHVLAVSGLHVGLIYLFLVYLLKLIPFHGPLATFSKLIVVVFGLWAFGFLTGLPASVQRSCTMFTFIALGEWLNNRPDIYNSIAASAFFLLLFNPLQLFDTGFQLSYLALVGIVYFKDWIYRFLYFKNKGLQYIWSLISVSLAAQLTVTPISLYYFHQFPTYFWLSGLVVVPLASLVLIGGMVYILALPILGKHMDIWLQLLATIIDFQNYLLKLIGELPFAKLSAIYISVEMLVLFYLAILSLMVFKALNAKRWLWTSLSLLVLVSIFYSFKCFEKEKAALLVFYDDYKHQTIDIKLKHRVYRLINTPELENDFHCSGFEAYHAIDSVRYLSQNFTTHSLRYEKPFIQIKNTLGAIIGKKERQQLFHMPCTMDFVYLDFYPTAEECVKLESLNATIVFSNRIRKRYMKFIPSNLSIHFIVDDGAKLFQITE